MKVRVEAFCNLATTPAWQAWLYNHNRTIYQQFIQRLQLAHSCSDNRAVMVETLKEIDAQNGGDALFDFLSKNYPKALIADTPRPPIKQSGVVNEVFPYYNPNLLTYPHRLILMGSNLERRVQEFVADKLKHEYVIVGDRAYIEYLTKTEASLKDSVPTKNWLVVKWRQSHQK